MPTAPVCPDLAQYKQLATGQLSFPDKEALLDHLEGCHACVQRIESLSDKDTLVDLIRRARTVGDGPADETVARLVERVRALRPNIDAAGNAPQGGTISTGTASDHEATEAHGSPTDQDLYDFLAPAQSPDELGRLGPYRVLKVLGIGGMGVVFQAEDPHLQRLVALKAMLPGLAARNSAKQRFLREARAAAALKHDHIVTIFQVGEDRGAPYLAMEFLEGEPLDDCLEREGKLPVADVLRIGREMAEGLAAAHERGLIHRDIKPANVWLEGKKGRVKILDFGLARAATDEAHLTQSGAIMGTPAYMAPEQAQGKSVDPRCDLFSLGCVLYRMTTGEAPFKGTGMMSTLMAVAIETPPPPVSLNAEVPIELSDFILKLLAKRPEERPEPAQAVANALERMAREKLRAPVAGAGRHGRRIAVAALVLAVLALLGYWLSGIILRVESKEGTLVIKTEDPSVEVKVTPAGGATLTYGKDRRQIQLKPGKYGIELANPKDGLKLSMTQFTIESGDNKTVEVFWEKAQPQAIGSPATKAQGEGGSEEGDRAGEERDDNALKLPLCWCPTRTIPGSTPRSTGIHSQGFHVAGFWMGKYEVTQSEWARLVGSMPSRVLDKGKGDRHPIYYVSHDDALEFCRKLTDLERSAGRLPKKWAYQLPTDVQWEYACRAGTTTATAFGDQLDSTQANFGGDWPFGGAAKGPSRNKAIEVGSFRPNAWGMYDMHGNVGEFVATPGRTRGGSWGDSGRNCCSEIFIPNPGDAAAHIGFRVARVRN